MSKLIVQDYPNTTHILFNNPKRLNVFNVSKMYEMRALIKATNKRLLISSKGRAFCAGGDLLNLYKGKDNKYEFFPVQYSLYDMINDTKFEKIAVMDGLSVGSGVGLGMICNKRILTDNTLISIPETRIGLITDIGGSYYLPKLINPEFGLYLALTGQKLSGPEAFYTGFSDIYIPKTSEALYQSLIHDEYFDISKYHKTPESSKAHILNKLPLISECFKLYYDIETIVRKLSFQNSPWARNCLKVINDQCPISLKIVQKLFEKNVDFSYSECLNRELNAVLRYIEKYPHNINNAVKTRLVNKSQSKLLWAPKTLHDVSSQLVEEICEYSLEKISYKL